MGTYGGQEVHVRARAGRHEEADTRRGRRRKTRGGHEGGNSKGDIERKGHGKHAGQLFGSACKSCNAAVEARLLIEFPQCQDRWYSLFAPPVFENG